MKHWFCTYFNKDYYIYGTTMFQSLKRTGIDMKMFVLCLDDVLFEHLQGYDDALIPIRLSDLEASDPETASCKNNRSTVEYFFTLTPALPLYLLSRFPEIDVLAYVDSDFYFFASPEPFWMELGRGKALIFEHDFSCHESEGILSGRFNVGFLLYRNDPAGKKILNWWQSKCIEWCCDRIEPDRFADQKYLDMWPVLFPDDIVVAEKTKAAGLAPWNIGKHNVRVQGNRIFSDGKPLIFFHFQNCKLIAPQILYFGGQWEMRISLKAENFLFGRYFRSLNKNRKKAPASANAAGCRVSAFTEKIFSRSPRLKKHSPFINYWGNVVLGIWRFHDFRPWGKRLFSYRRFL